MSEYQTMFGSLQDYEKGHIEIINDNPKYYTFSNIFEVAAKSKPYEKVAVAKNLENLIECLRAEGESPWFTASHDEFALVMDGAVEIHFVRLDKKDQAPADKEGTIILKSVPTGKKMGWVLCRRGHQALLPQGAAYQFRAREKGVVMLQTLLGDNTVQKWAEICITK
jgi:hypothetical protein